MAVDEPKIQFDDIGSFPLPVGVNVGDMPRPQYMELVERVMELKLEAGVEVPTYPQLRDMITMFMEPIADPERSESPYLVKKEAANIVELGALEGLARRRGRMPLRICVTGPVELYLYAFGFTAYADILYSLAESVARFISRAREGPLEVQIVSLDEPSLGISSALAFGEEEVTRALEIATSPCKDVISEVHLHSPLMAELCARIPGINVIGVESAAHPDYLQLIDRSLLEETDTYLRAGIARTDILAMVARMNDRLGINLWDDPARLSREVLAQENPQTLLHRLRSAWEVFGDRIRCAGPDRGLGSWPSQELAGQLLSNCALAIKAFREGREI